MSDQNDTPNPQDDALIASFFEAEKLAQVPPSDALMARVLADAAGFVPAIPAPARRQETTWWRRLAGADAWIGGAAIAASAVLGVAIGLSDSSGNTLVPALADIQSALIFDLDAEFATFGDTPFDFALLED